MKKKLTREEWEKIGEKEEAENERTEKLCEKLANTKPTKERLKHAKKVFR